jgi:hypothetical protein
MHTTAIPARRTLQGIEHFAVHLDDPPRALWLRQAATFAGLQARIVIFSCAILALSALGIDLVMRNADARVPQPSPAAASSPEPPLAPAWIDIVHPIPLFEIAGPGLGRLPLSYRARRREGADERQDFLTYGRFGDDAPFLGLSVLRKATPSKPADFFVDMARLGADQTLSVMRSALPTLLPTRFGRFVIADVTLARANHSVACLGFRLDPAGASPSAVEIGGFACGTSERAMDRALLGCVLDRIDLLSAGDDDTLRNFFVAAEQRRGQECTGSRLLSAGSKGLWLDAEATPPALRRLSGSKNHAR